MKRDIERNFGVQPLEKVLAEHKLKLHDIVAASTEQLTHKMMARAVKGRRLTPNVQAKVLRSVNKAAGKNYSAKDLFTY